MVCARRGPDLDAVAAEIGRISPETKCVPYACDVSSAEAVLRGMVPLLREEFGGRLDVLINNAGVMNDFGQRLHEHAEFKVSLDVNLLGVFNTMHHLLPLLLGTEGGAKAVVNVTSSSSQRYTRVATAYTVSKIGVNRFTESVADQYEGDGLVAFAVHPGGV